MGMNSEFSLLAAASQRDTSGSVLGRLAALLRGFTRPQTRRLRCVEALQLGPKRALYLVECDGSRFLAGGGNDGIHTLLPLPRPGEPFTDPPARDAQP